MNRGLDRAGSHSVVLGAATAMLMALATTGTSVSAAETSNDSSAGRAASGLGSQLVPVRFTSEEYRLRGEVYWHRGDQQPAVAVTPGDRAFARVQVDSRGDAGRSLEFSALRVYVGLRVAGTGWGHYVTRMPRFEVGGVGEAVGARCRTWSRLMPALDAFVWRSRPEGVVGE